MNVWKTTAFAGALVAAAGAGAALAPVAHGQNKAASVWAEPQGVQIWSGGGRLGVTARDVSEEDVKTHRLGSAQGVVIDEVRSESAAEKAGFRAGDVVLEYDGERVRSVRQFTRLVQETASGRSVSATVMRDGQKTTLKVQPSDSGAFNTRSFELLRDFGADRWIAPPARPIRPPSPPSPPKAPAPLLRDFDSFVYRSGTTLGIGLNTLTPQLAEYFGTKDGVLVTSVTDNSAAAKAGVKAGDIITAVNAASVDDPSDVRREIQRLDAGEEFTLTVVRDKKTITLKGKTDQRQTRRGRVVL